ncbi:MAG: type I-C CRISPR-associated endonuclease Cas1c [Blastocatellia bacterium]
MDIRQNTLFLTTENTYVGRDHLTLRIEIDKQLRLAVPVHHLESVCVFGYNIALSPAALQLCWENGVAVNYLSEHGYLLGRWEGVPRSSVLLRQAQFRAADNPAMAAEIAGQCVTGKIQNARVSLLRSARETDSETDRAQLQQCAADLQLLLRRLQHPADEDPGGTVRTLTDRIRGYEGQAASLYFAVFDGHLRGQRADFSFTTRSRRPPRDLVNCLLSYLYALVRHDCIAALTATGLDPFVGFLHAVRANRPALALDLMEEFRPLIADRLAMTLINRKQITKSDFVVRDGGAVEFTPAGRKTVISAYQERKKETVTHPLLQQECPVGQLYLIQARILARRLRGDLEQYLPCVLK